VSGRNRAGSFSFGWLRWVGALASVTLLLLSFWFLNVKSDYTPEAQLAQVSTEEVVTYLQDSDVTQQELMDMLAQTAAITDENLFQPSDITEKDLIEGLSNQEVEDLIVQ
jgi:hypothetical protein